MRAKSKGILKEARIGDILLHAISDGSDYDRLLVKSMDELMILIQLSEVEKFVPVIKVHLGRGLYSRKDILSSKRVYEYITNRETNFKSHKKFRDYWRYYFDKGLKIYLIRCDS